MNKTFFGITMLMALGITGCSGVQTYQDYPWGDYSWESDHNHRVNSNQAQDDYRQIFGHDQSRPPGG